MTERVANLKYGSLGTALELRILRKWIPFYKKTQTWFIGVDEHGDSVQILGEDPDQQHVESKFVIGHCYCIADYTCSETDPYQKALKNVWHINVGKASLIKEIPDKSAIPKFWFDFATMDQIRVIAAREEKTSATKAEELPDYIGLYKSYKQGYKVNGDPYINVRLMDESGDEIVVTLWMECSENPARFDKALLNSQPMKTAVAVTNVKVSTFGGLKLASTDSTHVYQNPPILETASLFQRAEDGTLTLIPTKQASITIGQLLKKGHAELLGKTFLIEAHIDDYLPKESWYTVTCRDCNRIIFNKGDEWFCTTHGKPKNPLFRYNITASLTDSTGSVTTMLTETTLQRMCGSTCEKMVTIDHHEQRKTIPPSILKYKNVTRSYCLQMTKRSTADRISFAITNIKETLAGQSSTATVTTTDPQIGISTPVKVSETTRSTKPQEQGPRTTTTPTPEKPEQQPKDAGKRPIHEKHDDIATLNPSKLGRYPD